MGSKTFHYVRPLDPIVDAAWRARAEIRFAANRALADEISAANVAKRLAAEEAERVAARNAQPAALPMAA